MKVVVDESVSALLAKELKDLGHEVFSIHQPPYKGLKNGAVYELVIRQQAVLITRDHHFLNPIRFPAKFLHGIVFIRHGNLVAEEETALVLNFLNSFPPEKLKGKRVILSKTMARIRD